MRLAGWASCHQRLPLALSSSNTSCPLLLVVVLRSTTTCLPPPFATPSTSKCKQTKSLTG